MGKVSDYPPLTAVDPADHLYVVDATGTTSKRATVLNVSKASSSPVQWLTANTLNAGANDRPQVIPSGSWTTVHWDVGPNGIGIDTTIGRPGVGTVYGDVITDDVQLTTAGPHTIKVAHNTTLFSELSVTGAGLKYLLIEDTVEETIQVVSYTGISTNGSTITITGVMRGNWNLTPNANPGRYNVRRSGAEVIDGTDHLAALKNRYYLANMQVTIGWDTTVSTAGVRCTRQVTWVPYVDPELLLVEYVAFQGSVIEGNQGISGVQTVNEYFQPGYLDSSSAVNMTVVQVYQNSGVDLKLTNVNSYFPAATCLFQSWSNAVEGG